MPSAYVNSEMESQEFAAWNSKSASSSSADTILHESSSVISPGLASIGSEYWARYQDYVPVKINIIVQLCVDTNFMP
jgi:hypothetical protein